MSENQRQQKQIKPKKKAQERYMKKYQFNQKRKKGNREQKYNRKD